MQSDINGKTGFALMCSLFNNEKSKERGIHSFYLTNEDIVRSEIVKYIVEIVEEYKRTLPIKK